jgi:hypothetical protein
MSDDMQSGSDSGLISFDLGVSPADADRRKRKRRAKRSFGKEVTELDLIPIMGLFTAMVLYLLKSYASDPIQIQPSQGTHLPFSTSTLAPQDAPKLAISERIIMLEGKVVARIENGRVKADFKRNKNPNQMFIVPLYNGLRKVADKTKLLASYNKDRQELEFKGLLTVIADKKMPFRLLTEVLYTAGQAEYGSYKFAVLKKVKKKNANR